MNVCLRLRLLGCQGTVKSSKQTTSFKLNKKKDKTSLRRKKKSGSSSVKKRQENPNTNFITKIYCKMKISFLDFVSVV